MKIEEPRKRLETIGGVIRVYETTSGLSFTGRVDTGAAITSIHCPAEAISIENTATSPADNVGKTARLRLQGDDGQTAVVTTRIDGYVGVKNADHTEHRYQVPLRLRCNDVERDVVVPLNDRSSMRYKLLIGRNFLRSAFVVDVSLDDDGGR